MSFHETNKWESRFFLRSLLDGLLGQTWRLHDWCWGFFHAETWRIRVCLFWSQERLETIWRQSNSQKNCWKDSIGFNLEIPRLRFIELEDCTASVGRLRLATTPTFSSLSSFATMAEDEKTPSVGTPVWTTDGFTCVCQVTGRGPLLHKTIILMDIDSVHNHIYTHIFYDLYLFDIYIYMNICIYIYLCVYIYIYYIWYVYMIIKCICICDYIRYIYIHW